MKTPIILLSLALGGGALLAQEPSPEAAQRFRAEKQRITHLQQAAENLQAAGMPDQAEELRARARRSAEELEHQIQRLREGGDRERADREPRQREGGDRERADREPRQREGGDRERADREPREREGGDREHPERGGPDPIPHLQAQIEELRATVHRLVERLERLEVAVRSHHDQPH